VSEGRGEAAVCIKKRSGSPLGSEGCEAVFPALLFIALPLAKTAQTLHYNTQSSPLNRISFGEFWGLFQAHPA